MKKRIVSILLAAIMVVAMIPATLIVAFAEDPSKPVITKVDSATLDGTNTDGEYDTATKVMLNAYGNDTNGDNMRIVYTEEAVYVLVEVFDDTLVRYGTLLNDGTTKAGSSKSDFVFLGFSMGTSFQGMKRVYRDTEGGGRDVFTAPGAYVNMSDSDASLETKYFGYTEDENGFRLEARFPVSEMSERDQAYYAAGKLEIGFTAGTQDGENLGTEFALSYDGDIENRGWDGAATEDYFESGSYKSKNPSNYPEYAFEFVSDEEVEVPASNYMEYVRNLTFDGKNTNGEYDNAESIPFAAGKWGATATGKESLKVVYNDDAIYVLLESKDTTDGSADNGDFFALSFSIGSSFIATQIDYRQEAPQHTNQGGEVTMSSQWSLNAEYFIKSVTAEGIAFEAKFPVSKMNDTDKAAFADRSLSVKVGAAISDNWNIVETLSGIYDSRASATSPDSALTALAFGKETVPFVSEITLDGVITDNEYDDAMVIPMTYAPDTWWGKAADEDDVAYVAYTAEAIYVYVNGDASGSTSWDMTALGFKIGNSYVGANAGQGRDITVANGTSNPAAYLYSLGKSTVDASFFAISDDGKMSLEAKFPLAGLTAEDKEAFYDGTLEVAFNFMNMDNYTTTASFAIGSYQAFVNQANVEKYVMPNLTSYTLEKKAVEIELPKIPYASEITLDGSITDNEYDDAMVIPMTFAGQSWWAKAPDANDFAYVVYTSDAIYVYVSADCGTLGAWDMTALGFKIGNSYVGANAAQSNSPAAYLYSLGESKVDASFFAVDENVNLEVRFPVEGMTEEDKAAFADRTLEIGFNFMNMDNYTATASFAIGSYQAFINQANVEKHVMPNLTSYSLGNIKSDFIGANIALGSSITVNYYAIAEEGAQVKFTMNGKEVIVDGVATGKQSGEYVFAFTGVAPQCMADNIRAELIVNGKTVAIMEKYSVYTNLMNIYDEDASTETLIADILAYGAAAQKYAGYKTDTLVNVDWEGFGVEIDEEELAKYNRVVSAPLTDAKFIASGVYYSNTNKLYAKFEADDVSKVTATINGVAAEIELYEDGSYIIYTDDIDVVDFDTEYTFAIETENGTQTLKYSVNAYANAKKNADKAETAELARALYAYGVSAEAYLAAING